jgi:eukaryotic-like serine/threonine-protein kinase
MAIFERPKSTERLPADLVPVLRNSGILTERQLAEIKGRMLRGEYPLDPLSLAERLVNDEILTVYQARRFLNNKPHGLLVGRYIILDRIGSGSMGRVYKAHHQMMDRVVALKIIAPEIASNEKVVARFQREMKLVGRLDHPNVVRAFDADQMGKILYIVMEYVPGKSLGERLKVAPIPAAEMFDYGAQAAMGLAHAHEQGMVHRDIKPSNMLLTEDRRIKILDLGLGVLMEADNNATFATADGIAVGTVDYMSPEQALGREVDGRSDIFSLGCAMFHLMTGKLAFPGDSPIDRLGRRISAKPVPVTDYLPETPPAAARVLEKMMALKPQDRFASAREASEALQGVLRPRSKPASVPRAPVVPSDGEPGPRSTTPVVNNLVSAAPVQLPIVISEAVRESPVAEVPGWFAPLARAARRRPTAVLLGLIATLAVAFGAGVGVGYMLSR